MAYARIGLFFAVVVAFLVPALSSDASESGWLDEPNITFTQTKEFTDLNEIPVSKYGTSTFCTDREVVIRPQKTVLGATVISQQTENDCMVDTGFGTAGKNYFIRSGSGVAGKLSLRNSKEFLFTGNNVSTGIVGTSTAPNGVYLGFSPNIASSLNTLVEGDGKVSHSLKPGTEIRDLKNAKNQKLIVVYDTVTFSSNGDWMVFDSPFYGLVRLNTLTGELLSFGAPSSYGGGTNPSYRFAVDATGRYVVQANAHNFKIYDLDTCVDQTGSLNYLKKCQSRDLKALQSKLANYGSGAGYMKFNDTDSFSYLAFERPGGVLVGRQYVVSMGESSGSKIQYLGLGDSFASGEGAFDYKALTDTAVNKCHLSLKSYPYLIGRELGYEKQESVACSGAVTEDLFPLDINEYEGQTKLGPVSLPVERKLYIDSFEPGTLDQASFVKDLNPEVVTVSIGGNDMAFGDKLKYCILSVFPDTTCFETLEDRRSVANEIYAVSEKLVSTYTRLKENGQRVYVIGYPKIVKPNGNCATNVSLSEKEVDFANKLTVLLNDAVEFAAGQAGVFYVDVEDIFEGRRLCETQSADTLIHGVTDGYINGPQGIKVVAPESFHPKAEAGENYKQAILQKTNNLTAPMPAKSSPRLMPRLLDTDDFFKNTISDGSGVYVPRYNDFVDDRVHIGDEIIFGIDSDFSGFGPLVDVAVEIHSDPLRVGEFKTDHEGDLNISINIPRSLDPGFHAIHIYGTNQAGESIDIYDYVLIGFSFDDFDGNGVLDSEEGCVFIEESGIDSDADGIDDACDGFVDPSEIPDENQDTDQTSETPEDSEVITPVPTFGNVSFPKDGDFNNPETVAGSEPAATNTEQKELQQNPVTENSVNTSSATAVPFYVAVNTQTQDRVEEDSSQGEVLSSQDAESEENIESVTVPASSADDRPPEQKINNTNVYLWYLIAGIATFVGLVAVIFIARRR